MRIITRTRVSWASAVVVAGMISLVTGSVAVLRPDTPHAGEQPPAAHAPDTRTSTPVAAAHLAPSGPVTLKPTWTVAAKAPVTVQPTVDSGVIYWG